MDIAEFRAAFPAFASEVTYPDAMILSTYQSAICFIPECSGGACHTRKIYLMLAHLLTLQNAIATNNYSGIVNGSTIDKVSVTLSAPPFGTSQFKYWLNLTPYGQELLALLAVDSAGGFYVGGRGELSAFRKVRGRF